MYIFSIFVSFCIFNMFFYFFGKISYDIKKDRVLNSLKLCLFLSK
nr:MAG TPA: hypothetical protein [Caudoviricetes sp.]